jgi:hypothetical protein
MPGCLFLLCRLPSLLHGRALSAKHPIIFLYKRSSVVDAISRLIQRLIKLLNADSQFPGFVSAGSAYRHLQGLAVNAIPRPFASQASRAFFFPVMLSAPCGQ